jgi:hypothetical protein
VLGKTDSVPSLNRRADRRQPCPVAVTVTVLVLPDCGQHTASVRDLSPAGVGLALAGAGLEPGARVLVQLPGPQPGTTHTALAEVVHATPDGEGRLVGCKFLSRLSPGQVWEALGLGG